jgi:hypothetical protein
MQCHSNTGDQAAVVADILFFASPHQV